MATAFLLAGSSWQSGLLRSATGGRRAGARTGPFRCRVGSRRAGAAGETLGDGRLGKSLVLFSLLRMSTAAFPIIIGMREFVAVGIRAAMRFIRSRCYAAPAAIGLTARPEC